MIKGFFGADQRPYFLAWIELPRLAISYSPVLFLLDSGADRTMITPRDALRLGIDFQTHFAGQPSTPITGVGGFTAVYEESCRIALLHEDGTVSAFAGSIMIAGMSKPPMTPPSLLGRDVFTKFRLEYDFANGLLALH